jgi:hypothetical protein
MKKIILTVAAIAALTVGAFAAFAAYDVTGSSGGQGFTSGEAANIVVNPDEADLNGILPTQTRTMDVSITNNNASAVTITGLTLAFNDGGVCAFTYAPIGTYPFGLGASSAVNVTVDVTMGNAAPECEANAGLTVDATVTGTLP